MFSGISGLFCVNYGHSVVSEFRSDWQAQACSTNEPHSSKGACFCKDGMSSSGECAILITNPFEPNFGSGNGDLT
jgi:hypothetical protein